MRVVALLALVLPGCVSYEETPCNPGPFWEGPYFENPAVGAAGDASLVIWRSIDHDGTTLNDDYTGAIVDPAGAITPLAFDERFRPHTVLSGDDHAVVLGDREQGGRFAQLRRASGEVVATLEDPTGLAGCAYDGTGFLLYVDGGLVPLELDGTLGPPIPLPEGFTGECHRAGDLIWMVREGGEDEPTRAVRIRDRTALDVAPRVLVAAGGFFRSQGARPGELALIDQDRDGVRTWRTFGDDGEPIAEVPLALATEVYTSKRLLGETDAYLMIGFDNELIRIAPDGTQLGAALREDRYAINNVGTARNLTATTIVFAAARPGGEPPQVGHIRIPDGAEAEPMVALETSVGAPYTVDCGCRTTGGSGWLAMLALLGLRRRPRARRC